MNKDNIGHYIKRVQGLSSSKEQLIERFGEIQDTSNAAITAYQRGDVQLGDRHANTANRNLNLVQTARRVMEVRHEGSLGQETWPGKLGRKKEIPAKQS